MRFDGVDDPRYLFAERLDRSFDSSVTIFHSPGDPSREPAGSPVAPSDIVDHVVIASSGLWVVVAEDATGRVAADPVSSAGGGRSRLTVGGVDHSALLDVTREQAAEFVTLLGDAGVSVSPVQPAVCLLRAEWEWFARPVVVDGVLVTWPSELIDDIKGRHWWDSPTVARVADRVAATAFARMTTG